MDHYNLVFPGIIFSFLFPLVAYTNPILKEGSGMSFNEQVVSWTNGINSLAPSVSFLFNAVFTIMFLFGIVRMGYSYVTKTGQVMKMSTGLLIWVPITFFFIRIFIIVLFTTNSKNVTLLASEIVTLIQTTGYYTSLGMVLIGLVLFMFYRFIEHPEYQRWSKRLWVGAAVSTLLATIAPLALGAA
ncbi:hypothetical protein [Neobacillus sp.]|uniref:hypothetical protein n=1 Tax=Neobacillus sp. TaxID=2675273 RepID=UPI0035B52449